MPMSRTTADGTVVFLESAPFWEKQAQRARQAHCGVRMSVQTDPTDPKTLSAVEMRGPPPSSGSPKYQLNAAIACLIPGLAMATFTVQNTGDVAISVRGGLPTLPWLVVTENDRTGFTIPARGKADMLVMVDSSVYDNENDVTVWPVRGLQSRGSCPVVRRPFWYTTRRHTERCLVLVPRPTEGPATLATP